MSVETVSGGVGGLFSGVFGDSEGDVRLLAVGAVVLVVVLPLLPVLAVAWLLSRTLEGVKRSVSWD